MSLVDIAHPAGTGHDELVPSRYSLRVGEIEVLRSVASRFLDVYRGQLRPFEMKYEVAPAMSCSHPGSRTPSGTTASSTIPWKRPVSGCVPTLLDH